MQIFSAPADKYSMRLTEMYLDEVTGAHEKVLQTRDWQDPKQVIQWLKNQGFEQKGSGKFGAVYAKQGYDKLVKISKKQDECWLRFAHWTLGMTSNPSVPYIDWVRTYGGDNEDQFFIAVIERLAPFNRSAILQTRDLPGLVYLYLYEWWFDGDHAMLDRFWKEGILDDDVLNQRGYFDKTKTKRRLMRWLKANVKGGKLFINALRSAQKKAKGRCEYDIHDGNIMYRPADRRLVVIDPLADANAME